jgi:hypothetical protein
MGCCGGDGRWLAVARGVAVAALLAWFWRDYVELHRSAARQKTPAKEWILAVAVGVGIFFAWIHLDRGWLAFEGGPGFDPTRPGGGIDWHLALLRLLALALVVPVMEEVFWRSFLMRWIAARDFLAADPRRIGRGAFVISSALFAMEHSLWFAGLLAGLAYGWLYMRSGNLWISIVSHTTTNGLLGLWILATGNWRFW